MGFEPRDKGWLVLEKISGAGNLAKISFHDSFLLGKLPVRTMLISRIE